MPRIARLVSPSPSADPLFAVAMLRIALELKKAQAAPLDQVVSQVVARMRLDGDAFRRYLDANLGLLKTSTRRLASPVSSPAQARVPARSRRTQRG